MNTTPSPSRRNLLIVPAVLLLAGAALTACGGSKAASSAPTGPIASGSARPGNGNRGGAAPAAYGVAAEVTGSSVEVQDPATGQVTVNFTGSTAFSQTRAVTAAAIKVGGCVTAIGARTGPSGSSASPAPTASGQRPAMPTSFTAASVTISTAVNGNCAASGFGGGFGGGGRGVRPSGSERPTERPSGRPSGGFGGGFGGLASGKVSSLAGSVLQVQVAARGNQPAGVDTVTLAPSTTYSETATVSSTALKVGECVTATGKADSTGAVAATRIALSTAGPDGCSTGFGRRPQADPSSTGA